jgi:hypothetical protein
VDAEHKHFLKLSLGNQAPGERLNLEYTLKEGGVGLCIGKAVSHSRGTTCGRIHHHEGMREIHQASTRGVIFVKERG